MRVSLQPAHSASTTVSTKERPSAFPLSAGQKVCMRVSLQPALSASTTDSTRVGRQRRKGHSGRKNKKKGRGEEVRKEQGGVKMKWPYNKNTLNLQGVKIERGGCQKKAGGGQKKAGGGQKKAGPMQNPHTV